jgi:asparagine synthase (glutamine-hydrolysing)
LVIIENGTKISIITDHFGTIPLYVFQNPQSHILIASSLSDLAISGIKNARLDKYGAIHTLKYGHSLGSRTLLEGVDALLPGTMHTWDCRDEGLGCRKQTYWKLVEAIAEAQVSPRAAWDKPAGWSHAFRNAWDPHLDSHEPVGMGLSGGLDSRLLLGMLLEDQRESRAVTFFGDVTAGDLSGARGVARRTGISYRELPLNAKNFLEAVPGIIRSNNGVLASASYLFRELGKELSSLCRQSVFITSAEIFFGSRLKHISLLKSAGDFQSYLKSVEPFIPMAFLSPFLNDRLSADYAEIEDADLLTVQFRGMEFDPVTFHVSWDLFQRQRGFIFSNVTASLSQGVDVFEPHFATEPLNLLLSIPNKQRIGRAAERNLIAGLYPHLAALPESADGLPISNKIFWRLLRSVLNRIPQIMPFEGPYHCFQFWWQDPEMLIHLKQIAGNANLFEAGILKSPGQLDTLCRLTERKDATGEHAASLLYGLYSLASVIDSWGLSVD